MSTEDLASLIEIHKTLSVHQEKLVQLELAFPDGPVAHRLAHQAMMKLALEDGEFLRSVKLEAAKKGVWIFIVVAVGLMWLGLEVKLRTLFGIGVP